MDMVAFSLFEGFGFASGFFKNINFLVSVQVSFLYKQRFFTRGFHRDYNFSSSSLCLSLSLSFLLQLEESKGAMPHLL